MKDYTNSIEVFWKENNEEKGALLLPDWSKAPEEKWENGLELYHFGLNAVLDFFKTDKLPEGVKWCFSFLETTYIDPNLNYEDFEKIANTKEYMMWHTMKLQSTACGCAGAMVDGSMVDGSMRCDAYTQIMHACAFHNRPEEDVDSETVFTNGLFKDPFWTNYLFDNIIHGCYGRADKGSWIFPDGSFVVVETGSHRCFVEEYIGLKEQDVEKNWIKVQMYTAYTHKNMTDAQKKTLNQFFKKYERLKEEFKGD